MRPAPVMPTSDPRHLRRPAPAAMTGFATGPLRAFAAFVLFIAACLLSAAASAQSPGPLEGRLFGNQNGRVLVVTLHGDLSDGSDASYHYDIARGIAGRNNNVLAMGILRPGYADGQGLRSRGSNNGRRDHYTRRNNQLVADTIQNLRNATGATQVIAIGHSGGAAQLGVIIGSNPGLIDTAILVSCPCDITRWRQMRGRGAWNSSLSPSDFVRRVPASTRVIAVTGANDDNTVPVLAQTYIAQLQSRGISAAYVEVPGAGHSYGQMSGTVQQLALQAIR